MNALVIASWIFAGIGALLMIVAEGLPGFLEVESSYSDSYEVALSKRIKHILMVVIIACQLLTIVFGLFFPKIVIAMIVTYIILMPVFYTIVFFGNYKFLEVIQKITGKKIVEDDDNDNDTPSTTTHKKGWLKWVVIVALLAAITALLVSNSAVLVKPGQRAVKTTWGKIEKQSYEPGIVWQVPFTESLGNKVITVETRPQRYGYDIPVRTKEMQKVSLDCSVLLEINPDSVHVMYDKYQGYEEYEERVVKDMVNSVVLSISSKMDFWSFAGNETEMMDEAVEYIVRDQLSAENLVKVSAFRILSYKPSKEVEDLIEEIVKTKKGVELEKYKVEQARIATQRVKEEAIQEYERMAAVAKANGIDVKIKAEALRNPFVAQYELAKAIQKWNGELSLPNTLMMMGGGTANGGNTVLPVVPLNVK